MSSWARPGVRCVCVDASLDRYGRNTGLVARRTYTVKAVAPVDAFGVTGLILEEINAPDARAGYGFNVDRFRPLITRTQEDDVALFRDLLTDAPVEVSA